MPPKYEELSREELLEMLRALQADPRLHDGASQTEQVIHDLQVHQIELEMQNRELRESQQRLEESRSRYADLFDFAPVGYCTLDRRSLVLEANLSAAALFGVDRSSLVGSMLITLVPVRERHNLLAHLRSCFEERTRTIGNLRLKSKTGPLMLQLLSVPLLGPDGEVTTCKTAITDITLIKQSEERVRLLATASEVLTTSFDYLANLASVVRLVVPEFADVCFLDLIDESRELRRVEVALAGQSQARWVEILKRHPPRYQPKGPQAEVLRSGEPMFFPDCSFQPLSETIPLGGTRIQSLICVPLVSGGRVLGVFTFATADSGRRYLRNDFIFAQDLAARAALAIENARLYEEAQRAIRARQEVLSVVCHDLRNPLSIVALGTGTLLESFPRPDPSLSRRQLELMRRAAKQMERMVADLLDMSSIEAGHLAIDLGNHLVGKLIDDAVEMLSPFIQEKALQLKVEVPAQQAWVRCDRERLLQVFANLAGNAIKFAPEGASIRLVAEIRDQMVRFCVEDTGPGIAPSVLRKLFERFWQARETAKKGRGLGLFISKGIIEAQGGKIWVESEVGRGTTFFFTLPMSLGVVKAQPLVARRAATESGQRLVLLVDDDPDVREMLTIALTERGYEVMAVASATKALSHLEQGLSPNLILLDLLMPDVDGWTFLAQRNRDPLLAKVPVIVLSAQPNVAERVAEQRALYLKKPVGTEHLVQTIEQVVH